MKKTGTAALALIVLMSSCSETKKINTGISPEPTKGSETLYQYEWKLAEAGGQFVPSASKAMLVFTPGQLNKVSGSTGCNRISGTFELSSFNNIHFSPLATTRMACLDDNAVKLETAFTGALAKTDNWTIINDQLLLKNGAAIVAKFNAQKPATAEQLLLNGTWELNYISGTKIAFEGLFPNKKPTISFNFPATEATGNGSCNGYSVKVKVDGHKINFGDALSTMMACEGNGEPVFFSTLKMVTSFSINDNILTMMMDDIAVMRFQKK